MERAVVPQLIPQINRLGGRGLRADERLTYCERDGGSGLAPFGPFSEIWIRGRQAHALQVPARRRRHNVLAARVTHPSWEAEPVNVVVVHEAALHVSVVVVRCATVVRT